MLKKTELKKVSPCDCPEFTKRELEKCQYIVAAKVVNVKGCGEILVADYYTIDGFNLQARFFSDGKNYITYVLDKDEWTTTLTTTILADEVNIPCKEHDEEVASDFLGVEKSPWRKGYYVSNNSWISYQGVHGIVNAFINGKNRVKSERARDLKAERLKRHMNMFPEEYPADLTDYLDDVAFKHTYIFFSKLDKKRKRNGVCGHCEKKFRLPADIKNKQATECPKCHKPAFYCADRFSPKAESVDICIPYKVDGQLLLEFSHIKREYSSKKPIFHLDNFGRTLYLNENGKQKIKSYGYQYCHAYWGSYWSDWGKVPIYRKAYVYPNCLDEVFGERYYNVSLKKIFENQPYPFDLVRLLDNLKNEPITEYLCKLGLFEFAASFEMSNLLNTEGKNFAEVFNVKQNYFELYHDADVTVNEHKVIESSKEFVTAELLDKYRKSGLPSASNTVLELLEHMTLTKLINYTIKQKAIHKNTGERQLCVWLRDYIDMCSLLGVKPNKSTMFPTDIKEAHDRLLPRYNIAKAERMEKESAAALKLVNEFFTGYTKNGFTVKVPHTRKDFVVEGEQLHHCVGGERYYNNHIKGERMIFFIRDEEKPDTPLYTAEIDMTTFNVLQLYGMSDKPAPKTARDFTRDFAQWLKRAKKTMAKAS